MRLVRFETKNGNSSGSGILEGDRIYQTSFTDSLLDTIRRGIKPEKTSRTFEIDEVNLLAPLKPGKILALGRNYADHAKEMGNEIPEKPLIFAKMTSSVIGPNQVIQWRESITQQVDWEGELAVVIGKRASNVTAEEAPRYIFGYTIANDVSARDLQVSESQWARAKGLDTFCPLGPCVVSRDELSEVDHLSLETRLNGDVVQNGNTDQMIHKIPDLIAYLSKTFTLEPGDVVLTGTPSGVGKGMKPPRFLTTGDTVSITIEGIGTLTNSCQIIPES